MPKTLTKNAPAVPVQRPRPGEPGSGHLLITEHFEGRYRATCFCRWPFFEDCAWRTNYNQVRGDWERHAAEVGGDDV